MNRLFRKSRFGSVVDLLVLLAVGFVLQLVVVTLMAFAFPEWVRLYGQTTFTAAEQLDLGRLSATVHAVVFVLLLGVALAYRKWRGGGATIRCSMRGFHPTLLLWGVVMMLAAGVVIEPLLAPLVEVFPLPAPELYGRGPWAVLALVVLAPVLEELLCRGIVLEGATARYGAVAGLLLSAAFFGALHFHPALAVNALFMGLIFGFIYMESRSIWSVMVLHALNNGVAYVLLMFDRGDLSLRSWIDSPTVYGVVYGVALSIFAASGWMMYRKCVSLRPCEEESK